MSAASDGPPRPSGLASVLKSPLLPIWLAVFVQMLGVGITLSTLPLMMTNEGISPNGIGVSATPRVLRTRLFFHAANLTHRTYARAQITISCFSAAQMIGAPLLVSLSNRPNISRLAVLRACLSGNAIAALLTAVAGGWRSITIARILGGTFAASIPVAQVAVASVVPPGPQTSKALTRVASAQSLGIVIGPAAGGLVGEFARTVLHVPRHLEPRCTFAASGLFTLCVLLLTSGVRLPAAASAAPPPPPSPAAQNAEGPLADSSMEVGGATTGRAAPAVPAYAQPIVRWIGFVCAFSVTTGIAMYSVFAQRFLGYGQPQISAAQSAAAAAALLAQLVLLPRMLDRVGEAYSCIVGLLVLGLCTGGNAIVRTQPYHALLYVLSRAGHAFTETSTAAIAASASTPATRGRNLALLQSVQSGSRLFSPLVASYLFTLSINSAGLGSTRLGPPGALPFLVVGAMSLLTAPAPLLLRRLSTNTREKRE